MRSPRHLLPTAWLCWLWLLPAASWALERPTVGVKFSLAEPIYSDRFTDADRSSLEKDVTSFLSQRLADEIGFLHFVAGGPATLKITFRLGDPGASRTSFHAVEFHISLSGLPGVTAAADWPFRDANAWGTGLGGVTSFEKEIRTQLSKHALGDLVPQVLSSIPVASDRGVFKHFPPPLPSAWILPFGQADLCMGFTSEVKLDTEVSTEVGPLPHSFRAVVSMAYNPPPGEAGNEELRNGLVCLPLDGQDGREVVRLSDVAAMSVKKIFVTRYFKMLAGCHGPAPPAAVAGSLGGGQ